MTTATATRAARTPAADVTRRNGNGNGKQRERQWERNGHGLSPAAAAPALTGRLPPRSRSLPRPRGRAARSARLSAWRRPGPAPTPAAPVPAPEPIRSWRRWCRGGHPASPARRLADLTVRLGPGTGDLGLGRRTAPGHALREVPDAGAAKQTSAAPRTLRLPVSVGGAKADRRSTAVAPGAAGEVIVRAGTPVVTAAPPARSRIWAAGGEARPEA